MSWILKILGKWIGKKLIRAIKHKIDLKRIDKYVNKPNELDRQVKSMQKSVDKYGKSMEDVEKDIAQIRAIIKKLKLFK